MARRTRPPTPAIASTAARALLDRIFLVSRLELASFAVILVMIVFKPGAVAA